MSGLMFGLTPSGDQVPVRVAPDGALAGGSAATPATPTDGSGTITTAGVAQALFGGLTPAHGFAIQNLSSADLWINDLAAPAIGAAGSICIPPGALYETPPGMAPGGTVRIVGAAAGQKFTARSW